MIRARQGLISRKLQKATEGFLAISLQAKLLRYDDGNLLRRATFSTADNGHGPPGGKREREGKLEREGGGRGGGLTRVGGHQKCATAPKRR